MNLANRNLKNMEFKFQNIVGRVTLFSYLFIFTLSIYHYHKIDLIGLAAIDVGNKSTLPSQISISEFGCVIYQNFSSLHTVAIPNSTSVIFNDYTKPTHLVDISRVNISQIFHSNNPLRAPPIFS